MFDWNQGEMWGGPTQTLEAGKSTSMLLYQYHLVHPQASISMHQWTSSDCFFYLSSLLFSFWELMLDSLLFYFIFFFKWTLEPLIYSIAHTVWINMYFRHFSLLNPLIWKDFRDYLLLMPKVNVIPSLRSLKSHACLPVVLPTAP